MIQMLFRTSLQLTMIPRKKKKEKLYIMQFAPHIWKKKLKVLSTNQLILKKKILLLKTKNINGRIFFKDKMSVLNVGQLKFRYIQKSNDDGRLNKTKMYEILNCNYYWPKIMTILNVS